MITFLIIAGMCLFFYFIVKGGDKQEVFIKKTKIFSTVPYNEIFHIDANRLFDPDYHPAIGDRVNLWKQPDSNTVNVYHPGSFWGSGLIGELENEIIADHVEKRGSYSAVIVSAQDDILRLQIILETSFPSIDGFSDLQKTKWLAEIEKPYRPQSTWELYFATKPEVENLGKAQLRWNPIEKLFFDDFSQNIWLEDSEGKMISEINKSGSPATVKTLRAINSSYTIKLKYKHNKLGYASFVATPIKTK